MAVFLLLFHVAFNLVLALKENAEGSYEMLTFLTHEPFRSALGTLVNAVTAKETVSFLHN
jgi:hypothetical protein